MSMLKTQIMTMFMMKGGKGNNDIFMILYSMMFMNFMEWLFKQAPAVIVTFQTLALAYFKPKREAWMPLSDKGKEKAQINSISMTRIFVSKSDKQDKPEKVDNIFVEKVDAVIDYLCSLDSAKHVKMDTRYSLNSVDEIELTPLLKAKVKESGNGDADDESMIEIMIYSTVLKVSDIRQWVDEIHSNYVFEKNNKLGNRIYYFNEVPTEPTVQVEMDPDGGAPKKSYRWDNMPKMLTFSMNEFKTSKSFNNVYGNHVDELKERLDLFINHPDWYMDRGIPHSLGILLHGVPGAGKTSTIKAVAKDTHRHIFNLSLRPYTSQQQLTNLFYNETVLVYGSDGNKQTFKIPLNRRVYVIEDIDCLTDVVLDRKITGGKNNVKEGDAVTLSFLLNLLDGVLETPGRILVITSNYPDKLDRAFVRPGRIDVMIEFKNANRPFILDMLNKFYTIEYTLGDIPAELDNIFTPAEVMESMCTHFKTPKEALKHMVQKIAIKQAQVLEQASGTLLGIEETADTPVPPAPPTTPTALKNEIIEAPTMTMSEDKPEMNSAIDWNAKAVAEAKISEKNNPRAPLDPKQLEVLKAPTRGLADFMTTEFAWAGANFGDAEFLPGGHMPGDFGTRSQMDLNLLK